MTDLGAIRRQVARVEAELARLRALLGEADDLGIAPDPDPVPDLRRGCADMGIRVSHDGYVDEAGAAQLLGKSKSTLRNWRDQYRPIPFRRFLGKIEYSLADIADLIADNCETDCQCAPIPAKPRLPLFAEWATMGQLNLTELKMKIDRDGGPKGSALVRALMAKGIARGHGDAAVHAAVAKWGSESRAAQVVKAAISASDLGAASSTYSGASAEWVAAVRERSVIGRPGFRRTALRVRTLPVADQASAAWVADGEARPISAVSFDPGEVVPRSLSAAIVVTDESLREGGPGFEDALRNELTRALAFAIDAALLDRANDGAGAAPASPLNGIAESVGAAYAIGDTIEAVAADFAGDLARSLWVCSPATAIAIHGPSHPNLGAAGGELVGLPVATTRAAPEGLLALLDPTRICVGFGETQIGATAEGSVEVSDTPSGDATTPTATNQVSLLQTGSVALKAELGVGWEAEPGAAAFAYIATPSSI